jgi:hypothetical protein
MYYRVSDNCLENLGSVDFLLAATIFKGNLDTSLDNRINLNVPVMTVVGNIDGVAKVTTLAKVYE